MLVHLNEICLWSIRFGESYFNENPQVFIDTIQSNLWPEIQKFALLGASGLAGLYMLKSLGGGR